MVARNKIAIVSAIIGIILISYLMKLNRMRQYDTASLPPRKLWSIQSIDTMKYSRDMAGQMLENNKFDDLIEKQVSSIAKTGATHIALGVPYDDRFLPIMHRWVKMARKYNLKVWFRGNLSGWEGWFEYPRISRAEHLKGVKSFIIKNGSLFEDGDLFSSCPECENGGPGDPRQTGDVTGHRQFLIDETAAIRLAMRQIDKNVQANLNSMNGDVARLIMDRDTTAKLGGFVVLDHYVRTPERLVSDIREIAIQSGGKIILGEYGAPIPDLHGNLTPDEQAEWISDSLHLLSLEPSVVGLNYWTGFGGSTKLWNDDSSERTAVATLTGFFNPPQITGRVSTLFGLPVFGANVAQGVRGTVTDSSGQFSLAKNSDERLSVTKPGYSSARVSVDSGQIYLKPNSVLAWLKLLTIGK